MNPSPMRVADAARALIAVFALLELARLAVAVLGPLFGRALPWAFVEVTRASTVAFVLAALAFLVWEARLVRRVCALHDVAPVTPAWAVGAWFVPFANVLVPWRHLQIVAVATVGESNAARLHLGAWWACLVLIPLPLVFLAMASAFHADLVRIPGVMPDPFPSNVAASVQVVVIVLRAIAAGLAVRFIGVITRASV